MRERLGILISGGGTTMTEIIKACQSGEVPRTDIACIIASNPNAGGMEKARKLSIPDKDIIVIDPSNYKNGQGKVDQDVFGKAIIKEFKERGVSIVTQNGWMPKTPENVIDAFPDAIFNQHPGPIPEFGGKDMYGRRVHAAVLYYNREMQITNPWTEVIGQRVAKNYDEGVVVKSAKVEILKGDTADDLQQRALPIEHRVQIEMLQDIVAGNVKVVDKEDIPDISSRDGNLALVEAKHAAVLLYPKG